MNKSKTGAGVVRECGDPQKYVAMDDRLFASMRQVVEALQAENVQLTKDLDYANKCWQVCAGQLRQAREKNQRLWDQLVALEVGGN